MDVVIISWRNQEDLIRLVLRLCTLVEAVGRQKWSVIILSRRLADPNEPSNLLWTQCPRHARQSTVRLTATGGLVPLMAHETIQEIQQRLPPTSSNAEYIANEILIHSTYPATRVALFVEVSSDITASTTPARHITSWDDPNTRSPYISLVRFVPPLGGGRTVFVAASSHLYMLVHATVAVAIGLMAAASGRGLAVWIFSVRLVVGQVGGDSFSGDEALWTLLGFDGASIRLLTSEGSEDVAGDLTLAPMPRFKLVWMVGLGIFEVAVVGGGWVYGALHTRKLSPVGLVGHGMLWLATVVGIALSIRTLYGLHERLSGRLIGIFGEATHSYHVLPKDFTISSDMLMSAGPQSDQEEESTLQMVFCLLQFVSDDRRAVRAALQLLRRPAFTRDIETFSVRHIHGYQYDGDAFHSQFKKTPSVGKVLSLFSKRYREDQKPGEVKDGLAPKVSIRMSTTSVYPRTLIIICTSITCLGACLSAAYAYLPSSVVPLYSKMIVEVAVSCAAVVFATADRVSPLAHLQTMYMSFMVASMVVSSVWYVGITDVG